MQTVSIKAEVTNEDGTKFADISINYYGVPREGVHAIEEQLISMQSSLLDVAKEVAAK
jgi:hypothetical protein